MKHITALLLAVAALAFASCAHHDTATQSSSMSTTRSSYSK